MYVCMCRLVCASACICVYVVVCMGGCKSWSRPLYSLPSLTHAGWAQVKAEAGARATVAAVFLSAGQFELLFTCRPDAAAASYSGAMLGTSAATPAAPEAPVLAEEPPSTYLVPVTVALT
jgi:hypothetical protein